MVKSSDINVRPVDKTNWIDFETLFQNKGGPNYCWCMAWRTTKEELKQNNPTSRKKYIHQRVSGNIPIGLLAYSHNEPIGWCSVAPRESYQRLGGNEALKDVWSIVCFFIRKEYRNRGLVEIFIGSAKKYAKRNGAKYLEAYPVEKDSPSYRFMGYVQTFERNGFKFIKKAGTRRNVMCCEL